MGRAAGAAPDLVATVVFVVAHAHHAATASIRARSGRVAASGRERGWGIGARVARWGTELPCPSWLGHDDGPLRHAGRITLEDALPGARARGLPRATRDRHLRRAGRLDDPSHALEEPRRAVDG